MNDKSQVWDLFVRVFHWSLVVLFITSYVSSEENIDIHVYSSYMIFGLLLMRIVWGFVGSKHARFSDFLYSPKEAIVYLKGLRSGKAKLYLGHTPAGTMMIFALFLSLFAAIITGFKVYGLEGYGPFAETSVYETQEQDELHEQREKLVKHEERDEKHDAQAEYEKHEGSEEEEFWEEIHEFFANFTIFLIVLHVVGVLVSSFAHKQNLIKSMITGIKKTE